jgi:selenocysteine lyase/cysteine desulfurase
LGVRSSRIDVARARRETPGCREVVHFNNAGASLMPEPVLDAVVGYLEPSPSRWRGGSPAR